MEHDGTPSRLPVGFLRRHCFDAEVKSGLGDREMKTSQTVKCIRGKQ